MSKFFFPLRPNIFLSFSTTFGSLERPTLLAFLNKAKVFS